MNEAPQPAPTESTELETTPSNPEVVRLLNKAKNYELAAKTVAAVDKGVQKLLKVGVAWSAMDAGYQALDTSQPDNIAVNVAVIAIFWVLSAASSSVLGDARDGYRSRANFYTDTAQVISTNR